MKNLLQWAAASLILCSGVANAGYITLDEAALDNIFSQPSLEIPGGVDVRVNPYQEVVRPDLVTIDSFIEIYDLWNSTPYDYPAIDLYFVDSILYCRGGSAAGCARLYAPDAMVSSLWAASSTYGSKIIAHELGHTFGLRHTSLFGNLMYPFITPRTELSALQGRQMLRSSLLQRDQDGYFMKINPIAVVAEPTLVPEPPSILLGAVLAMGLLVREFRLAHW